MIGVCLSGSKFGNLRSMLLILMANCLIWMTPTSATATNSIDISIGIFVQVGNINKWNDLFACIKNVFEAKDILDKNTNPYLQVTERPRLKLLLDVYVTYNARSTESNTTDHGVISTDLKRYKSLIESRYITPMDPSYGLDAGQHILQLHSAVAMGKDYDVLFKPQAKSDKVWANHVHQCLCGTPAHVLSILNEFVAKPKLQLIVPRGMVFSASTPKATLHPLLQEKYFKSDDLRAAFASSNIKHMRSLHKIVYGKSMRMKQESVVCMAGTAYWAKYRTLQASMTTVDAGQRLATLKKPEWSLGTLAAKSSIVEHALERLVPSLVSNGGGEIGEMIPAPKALPLYFPQYHRVPENDEFHGEGFTEWTLLKPLKDYKMLQKPLDASGGGLGYYDLTEIRIRRKQAELARFCGVHGFVFYHYWFSGPKAPDHHKVMYRIPELRLLDGEPNLPFMFSWANEPWTRTWSGEADQVLLSQEYGERSDWIMHFEYLLQFFQHPQYIKVNGKPAFAIYRIGHFGKKLQPILYLWNQMAKQHGFPGIHFINTIGNFLFRDTNTVGIWNSTKELEASFHFRPQIRDPYNQETEGSSVKDLPLPVKGTQYWGAFTNFDARPRRPNDQPARTDTTPDFFQYHLKKSFAAMSHYQTQFLSNNLYFITAWNEWNEQAVLEPSNKYGNGYLVALKTATETIPVRPFMVV